MRIADARVRGTCVQQPDANRGKEALVRGRQENTRIRPLPYPDTSPAMPGNGRNSRNTTATPAPQTDQKIPPNKGSLIRVHPIANRQKNYRNLPAVALVRAFVNATGPDSIQVAPVERRSDPPGGASALPPPASRLASSVPPLLRRL